MTITRLNMDVRQMGGRTYRTFTLPAQLLAMRPPLKQINPGQLTSNCACSACHLPSAAYDCLPCSEQHCNALRAGLATSALLASIHIQSPAAGVPTSGGPPRSCCTTQGCVTATPSEHLHASGRREYAMYRISCITSRGLRGNTPIRPLMGHHT